MPPSPEQRRIARYFAPLAMGEPGSAQLTNDGATLTPPPGSTLVFTTDSVIEGVHVFAAASPQQFAQKLVRRNLSDLAAMGAMPWRYLLNIHLPESWATGDAGDQWLADFASALQQEQTHFGMILIGGDSTCSGAHIHTTMTCIGLLQGAALQRNTAQAGDDIYVSGTIGDAALGLRLLQRNIAAAIPDEAAAFLIDRYHLPQPRIALGQALHGIATSAMDISDGLLADMAQIERASQVEMVVDQAQIPLSAAAQQWLQHDPSLWQVILHGGDDYELLFTAPAIARERIAALAETLALPLTRIGVVTQ